MKKKAILSIVGKVKGFVRSVSGTPPIALEACADNMSIIDYKIHGNSIQDGTPSPDNPVEVQSVGELVTDETDINYGKYKIPVTARSKNLFDEKLLLTNSKVTKTDDGYIIAGYPVTYNSSSSLIKHIKSVLKPNVTYTLSRYVSGYVSDSIGDIQIRNSSAILVRTYLGGGIKSAKFTFTQEQIDSISYVYIYGQNLNNLNAIFNYIQLEEGTAATDYEPYHEPITTNIYLDEPLRKVGDYADYIDFKNSVVVRNISKYPLVMPHPGAIYRKGTNTVLLSFWHPSQGAFVKNSKILCPIFKNIQNAWYLDLETIHNHNELSSHYYCGLAWSRLNLIYDGTKAYRSDDETQTELTNKQITDIATAYLRTISEEYRVVYAIPNTPTETSISLPILPTFKGITTVYEVGTTIQPSNMEAEYYSTLKGE